MNAPARGRFEREYFDRFYVDYRRQNPPAKLRFYRSLVEPAARGSAPPRVLDLGCAFGTFLDFLGDRWDRFGIDVSEFAIARARETVPRVDFAVSSMDRIPFPGRFDAVTAFDVIEHFEDPAEVMRSAAARLAPGGRFVFVVPVYDGPTGPLIRLLDRDVTHLHKTSRRFWLDLAGRSFRILDWWGIYRYLLPWGTYLHAPTRVLRRFTPAIAVVCGPS